MVILAQKHWVTLEGMNNEHIWSSVAYLLPPDQFIGKVDEQTWGSAKASNHHTFYFT